VTTHRSCCSRVHRAILPPFTGPFNPVADIPSIPHVYSPGPGVPTMPWVKPPLLCPPGLPFQVLRHNPESQCTIAECKVLRGILL
jgi:hypothetical protein